MPTAQATQLTPKGERTREHILDTALGLFIEQGYDATTMREIAAAAECSLGLTYRYFARKEDLVLALYQRTADDQEAYVQSLPPAPIADRFALAMHAKIAQIAPYRDAFGALFGAPRDRQARQLATVLYALHLAMLLFWLHDRSPDQRATNDLIKLARDTLALVRPVLRVPPISKALARLAQAIEPVFGGKL